LTAPVHPVLQRPTIHPAVSADAAAIAVSFEQTGLDTPTSRVFTDNLAIRRATPP
jgi:hypothetical protein